MQRHAAPAYAFCAHPLAPVSCIHSEKPAPLHAMLSCCGGGDGGGGGDERPVAFSVNEQWQMLKLGESLD